LNINHALAYVWPSAADFQVKMGIPAALIPVAIAATWQLSGFVMATYLGGMAAIRKLSTKPPGLTARAIGKSIGT